MLQPSPEQTELALELKEAFNVLSPFIEKHTAIVCPDCQDICCKDRHGRYDSSDLFFLGALGLDVPPDDQDRDPDGSCRHITDKGCFLERWMRPFRCTHFFCAVLLKSLENENAKLYRTFVDYLQYLVHTREKLLKVSQSA